MIALKNKAALITGSAAGIGRATALALAAQGAHLVIADIDEDGAHSVAETLRSQGHDAIGVRCDVTNDAEIGVVAKLVSEKFGGLDLLINNAYARSVAQANLDEIEIAACKTAFDVNVLGNLRMTKAFLPGMAKRGGARVVDTSTSLAILPNPVTQWLLPYMATKGAIIGLAWGMAHALREKGIAYSVFCPGLTATQSGPGTAAPPPVPPGLNPAPPELAASILLAGIQRGQFLISSEPGFEQSIVRFAKNMFDPFVPFS